MPAFRVVRQTHIRYPKAACALLARLPPLLLQARICLTKKLNPRLRCRAVDPQTCPRFRATLVQLPSLVRRTQRQESKFPRIPIRQRPTNFHAIFRRTNTRTSLNRPITKRQIDWFAKKRPRVEGIVMRNRIALIALDESNPSARTAPCKLQILLPEFHRARWWRTARKTELFPIHDPIQSLQVNRRTKTPPIRFTRPTLNLSHHLHRKSARPTRLNPPRPKLLNSRWQILLHRAPHSPSHRARLLPNLSRRNPKPKTLTTNPCTAPPNRPIPTIHQSPLGNQRPRTHHKPNLNPSLNLTINTPIHID